MALSLFDSALPALRALFPLVLSTLILSCMTFLAFLPLRAQLSTVVSLDTAMTPLVKPSAAAATTSLPVSPPILPLLAMSALLDIPTLPLTLDLLDAVSAPLATPPLELTASLLTRHQHALSPVDLMVFADSLILVLTSVSAPRVT